MKIVRKKPAVAEHSKKSNLAPWKVLLVDDEVDVLAVTHIGLKDFRFMGRSLQFIDAHNAAEARDCLQREDNIAVALIDVVMETDDAGLKLVEHIRNKLGNRLTRLIIRTGQPGVAPEREVVERYDIDDYKDKTELTAQKLFTTMRTAIKGYHDLIVLDGNRRGLEKILDAAPALYHPNSMREFFEGVLTQVIGLCNLGGNSCMTSINGGLIITADEKQAIVQFSQGHFETDAETHQQMVKRCINALQKGESLPTDLPDKVEAIPLIADNRCFGMICLEYTTPLSQTDQHLIRIMANQSAAAFQTLQLYEDLRAMHRQAVRMLAIAAEYHNHETGEHINRIQHYTEQMALQMGFSPEQAEQIGLDSILHDIGKVAIPDAILQKPKPLSQEEFDIIKKHPSYGLDILKNGEKFETAQQIAHYHHERWDGTGYPCGLKGEEIPLVARIVSVVDVFDALVNKRAYKKAWSVADALNELRHNAGTQFDPDVVEAFLTLWENKRFNLQTS